ncbi:MAG: hypothetical protein ACK4TA_02890 [Saprospiraceae bacterium]
MAQETRSLPFICYKCNTENKYDVVVEEGDKGGKTLLKRCTNCGAENKIKLEEGWVAARTEIIHRGTKNNDGNG